MKEFALSLLFFCIQQSVSLFSSISFSKQLYIPGTYFSLMNFSKNFEPLGKYYNIDVNFSLTQAAYSDQGNSIYDFFVFNFSEYNQIVPCYTQTIKYLKTLYN